MDVEIREYFSLNGKSPFNEWINSLRDRKVKVLIDVRLYNVRRGTFGSCGAVGENVNELKIHYGPGYRIYFGHIGKKVILLLCGGTKKSQKKDIKRAIKYWREYKGRL